MQRRAGRAGGRSGPGGTGNGTSSRPRAWTHGTGRTAGRQDFVRPTAENGKLCVLAAGVGVLNVLCLDLEGVLVPEVWRAVARCTGIAALRKTTRDIPVYDDLMRMRLAVLARHDLALSAIQRVISGLDPLPGAGDFLAWARGRFQVAVLSDTFYEFAMPLVAKLGHPLLLCHRLTVEADRIVGYRLRQADPKGQAVRAFQAMNYRVLAAGDSFNDIGMLEAADAGVLVNAPAAVCEQCPAFKAVEGLPALQAELAALDEAQV